MRSFVLVDKDGKELGAMNVPGVGGLPTAEAGCLWLEVPYPVQSHTILVVDGCFVPGIRPPKYDREKLRLKGERRYRMNVERQQAEMTGFEWNGNRFNSDEASQRRIQIAVMGALIAKQTKTGFSRVWITADNQSIILHADQMLQVGKALADHMEHVHNKAQESKANLE